MYSHNTANEYTEIGGESVSHDAAGNMTVDPAGYHYYYDYENRLVEVKDTDDTDSVVEYDYDALGRRMEMISYDDGVADATRRYYYDGWRMLTKTAFALALKLLYNTLRQKSISVYQLNGMRTNLL